MAALQYFDVPGYAALLIRKTYTDLALPGALMDRVGEWLRPTAATWSETTKTWRSPAGATLSFGYMDGPRDHLRYQGPEFQMVGLDEVTQFSDVPINQPIYLMSRLRRLSGVEIPLRWRAATNPGGAGHKWVAERFGIRADGTQDPAMTERRPFVPSKLVDNRHVDADPYREALSALPKLTRDQLEHGLWVLDTTGLIYPYTDANVIPAMPTMDGCYRVLAIDLGASESVPTTAFALLAWHPQVPRGVWVERSWAQTGLPPSEMAEQIRALQAEHGGFAAIVLDEGALGRGYGEEFRRRWAIHCEPAQKRDKLGYRKLLRGALEAGDLHIVGPANGELLAEMDTLVWDERGLDAHPGLADHLTDALLYGWRRCMAYASEAPAESLVPGSQAWKIEQDRLAEEREAEELRASLETPWYERL